MRKVFCTAETAPKRHRHNSRTDIRIVTGGGSHVLPLATAEEMSVKALRDIRRNRKLDVELPAALVGAIDCLRLAKPVQRKRSTRHRKSAIVPAADSETGSSGGAVVNAAAALQRMMDVDQFSGLWDELFGGMLRTILRAQANPRFSNQRWLADHTAAVIKMRDTLAEAMSQIKAGWQKDHPGEPLPQEVVTKAMQSIFPMIRSPLALLASYTTGLDQNECGPDTAVLGILAKFLESTFRLTLTGDLDAAAEGRVVPAIVPAEDMGPTDQIIAAFLGPRGGLGVVPGSLGPVACDLLMVPPDTRGSQIAYMAFQTHEGWHVVSGHNKTLAKERVLVIRQAIKEALAGGLKLKAKAFKLNGRGLAVPAEDAYAKLQCDWAEEMMADIRALLGHGIAFALASLFGFPAFNPVPVERQPEKLRDFSHLELRKVRGGVVVSWEPHPVDILRSFVLHSTCLEVQGRREDAEFIRAQTLAAIGGQLPETIKFAVEGAGEDGSYILEMPTSDLVALTEVVTRALTTHEFDSLAIGKGKKRSLMSIVWWDDKREGKALAIAAALKRGEDRLPADIGTVHTPYVVSGAIRLLWEEAMRGPVSEKFLAELQKNTFGMMSQCAA